MDLLILLIFLLFVFAIVGGFALSNTLFLVLIVVIILIALAGRTSGRTWW